MARQVCCADRAWLLADERQTRPHESQMSIDLDTVRKAARLARIAIPEERLPALQGELNGILAWIEQLQEVDISGVAPLASTVAMQLPMREDLVADGFQAAAVVRNAPKAEDDFFIVPKVVE